MGGASLKSGERFFSFSTLEIVLWCRLGVTNFVALGLSLINRSKSTSCLDGGAGTFPGVYGFPFSVAGALGAFEEEDLPPRENDRKLSLRVLLCPTLASCWRYSAGTNSSNRTSMLPERGSAPGDGGITLGRVVTGIALNST
jgi:hypothetical protein